MPKKPLEAEIATTRHRRERWLAQFTAEERKLAILLEAQAKLVEAQAKEWAENIEHGSVNSGSIVGKQMQPDTRLAISEGRKGDRDAFMKTIRARGFTMRSLAEKLGCSVSLLSLQRKGEKTMSVERAREIERLTGWPADARHWKRLLPAPDER